MTLLIDVLDYCARTRSAETMLGTAVMRDTSFVNRLRKGATPRPATERRVRRYMAEHPDGVVPGTAGRWPSRRRHTSKADADAPEPIPDRTPCFYCGVRGDIGCDCRK